jgi:hypothetical protein
MSKKTKRVRGTSTAADSDPGTLNPRQPCPCGSGKRYKACHGSGDEVIVLRPFAGLVAECDLVALREFVPSGQAQLTLSPKAEATAGAGPVRLVTVLPGAAAAMVRTTGERMVALQVQTRSGDISTDLGRALRWVLSAEPGEVLPVAGSGLGDGPVRLQDLVVADAPLEITLFGDFTWWLPEDGGDPSPEAMAALEHANKAIMPTEVVRGEGVRGAYWVDAGSRAHLRWVRPEPEDRLLAALARLAARDQLSLGEGSKFVGQFRAHGLLVPVWDLDREMHVKEWSGPAEAFTVRLAEALGSLEDTPPTDAERRARDSLAGRQVTLR